MNALEVRPPFREYYFIDIEGEKIESLKKIVGERQDVFIYKGNCNEILIKNIFPHVKYEQYRRALCLLDPYGLHLNWEVIEMAGKMRTIDVFLNFPIMDMNRNTFWKNPDKVAESDIERMNAFWGDDSWKHVVYTPKATLFGMKEEKAANDAIAEGFRNRLKNVAKFERVLRPMPMRNKNNAVVYYLFFASQKSVGENIAKYIFKLYQYHRYNNG